MKVIRNHMKKLLASLFIILGTVLIYTQQQAVAQDPKQVTAQDPKQAIAQDPSTVLTIEDGQELFGRTCQQCHNSRGIGGKCPTLVRGAWVPGGPNSDEFMFATIHDGRAGTQMGAFGGIFTDDEIWAIIKYLRLESVRIKKTDSEVEEEDTDRR